MQRGEFPPPRRIDPSLDRALEAICVKAMALRPEDRYANANDKVAARAKADAKNGEFEAEMELPKNLKPGKYVLKAWNGSTLGFFEIEIPEK